VLHFPTFSVIAFVNIFVVLKNEGKFEVLDLGHLTDKPPKILLH
jgi:hypothetical protein